MTDASITNVLAAGQIDEPTCRALTALLDLTSLDSRDYAQTVTVLCRRATRPCDGMFDPPLESVAAVCVYPLWIPDARAALTDSSVQLATVGAGFPSAQYPLDVRLADVDRSVRAGIDEMDIVINRGHVHAGRFDWLADEIRQVRAVCIAGGVRVMKVILETCDIGDSAMIRRTADVVIDAACKGTDGPPADGEFFLKTSTGKGDRGATLEAARPMLDAIAAHHCDTGQRIGFKAAGGIRTVDEAMQHVHLVRDVLGEPWLCPRLLRIGASSLLDDILRHMSRT